jgi:hypothetical protein
LGKGNVKILEKSDVKEFLAVGLGFPDSDTEFLLVDPETLEECPLGKVSNALLLNKIAKGWRVLGS